MIQYQHWEDSIRILVTDELHHGSVQVFIPKHTEDKPLDGEADALIYSLWVGEAHRGREVAKHLMEAVERELKSYGVKTVAISWDGRDSPQWVLHWYERLGYEGKAFDYRCCTLLKRL
jgi:ribosomal protein S18 acetylase RimI-like enzyme